ncbi:hypothetical protein F5Y03DRAFT_358842, partial [Xylaria venustula]
MYAYVWILSCLCYILDVHSRAKIRKLNKTETFDGERDGLKRTRKKVLGIFLCLHTELLPPLSHQLGLRPSDTYSLYVEYM